MRSGKACLRIAHAYGDTRAALPLALAAGVDMIEADVWFRAGHLWVRHERRLGPIPLLADRRPPSAHYVGPYAVPIWPRHYLRPDIDCITLREVLTTLGGRRRLLVDVKGSYSEAETRSFAERLAREVEEQGAVQRVEACGQNWAVLDQLRPIERAPVVRYTIESLRQWEAFLALARGDKGARRTCIHYRLMTEERVRLLEEMAVEVYCWTVDDRAEAERLVAAGAEGIISNDLSLLASLASATAR